jgi:Holliday junction resolvase RusA-like endonuclease
MTPTIYEAMIPLNPRTKKNSQRIVTNPRTKAPMILPDAKYREYEREAGWFLKKPAEPIKGPINIRCTFYRDSRRRCDLTNLLEAIDDILVKYQIIEDDNFEILAGHDGSRVKVDRDNPRTEIEITAMTD